MIHSLREQFNARFSQRSYSGLVESLEKQFEIPILFRISETPVFLPAALLKTIVDAARDLNAQLLQRPYLEESDRAIPEQFLTMGETPHPTFIQTDFAITLAEDGSLTPKLVELQGCASVHAFQLLLSRAYCHHYQLDQLGYLINGPGDEAYLNLLRRTIVADQDPAEVILMEIEPDQQKTLPDFVATEKLLGITTVPVSDVRRRGSRLFHFTRGREVPIKRIYNRVIFDELVQKETRLSFDYRDDLNVEWAGHPNWFFRLSKFSLPFLNHPSVPRSSFLSDLSNYPSDLENYVLKPLFSFAGSGVKVDITASDLDRIPDEERQDYLLQQKIHYHPAIVTPNEPSKVEVRVMFLWPDNDPAPTPTLLLCRMSQGAMMGVDFNRTRTWVGASSALFEL